jgi:hypothetical protein
MTVEDIKKYAIEKGMPKRALEDMVQRLRADYGEDVDDMVAHMLLAEIDEKSKFWAGVRNFLDWSRAEREKRRRERENK